MFEHQISLLCLFGLLGTIRGQVINPRGCRADVCFVMDESGSIGPDNWVMMTGFVSDFISRLYIDPTATQVGVVKFSSSATLTIALDDYASAESLKAAVLSLPYSGGGTSIHAGLRVARETCFDGVNGARSDVPHIIILMTDGQSSYPAAAAEGDLVRAEGIQVVSLGIGSGVDDLLLTDIAGSMDNYFPLVDFQQLLDDIFVILDQSCLASEACAGGQEIGPSANDSYPALLACPDLSNPILEGSLIEFACSIEYNTTDSEARFKVTFLFGGVPDPAVPSVNLEPPDTSTRLHDQHLNGRLNKYISCRVESYYTSSPSVTGPSVVSRSYWAGITPSETTLYLSEGDGSPTSVYFLSSLPITCPGAPPSAACDVTMDIEASSDDVVVFQPAPAGQINICRYRLRRRDWKENETLAYDVTAPLQVVARRDPFESAPRIVTLRMNVATVLTTLNYAHPFSDLMSEPVTVVVSDSRAETCRSVGDPWIHTLDIWSYGVLQQGCFYYVLSDNFEVQVCHFPCHAGGGSGCSIACSVAVREGGRAMGVYRCDDAGIFHTLSLDLSLITNQVSPLQDSLHMTTSDTLTQYMIRSNTGARVVVEQLPRGINVFIHLPAMYKAATKGLCGNFDGDSSNDFMLMDGSVEPVQNTFIDHWRVPANKNFFDGVGTPEVPTMDTTDFCSCEIGTNDRSSGSVDPGATCGFPALEDAAFDTLNPTTAVQPRIPWFLLENRQRRRKRQTDGQNDDVRTDLIDDEFQPFTLTDTFEGEESIPDWGTQGFTEAQAREECERALREAMVYDLCSGTVIAQSMDDIITPCMADIRILGNTDLVASRLSEFQRVCLEMTFQQQIARNDTDFDDLMARVQVFTAAVCMESCSGHGQCSNGSCVCDSGFIGADCSIDEAAVPVISGYLGPDLCDTQERLCQAVTLRAQGLVTAAPITCRTHIRTFEGATEVLESIGTQIEATTLTCPLPDLQTLSGVAYYYNITVSNNGQDFSATPLQQTRLVYDSRCTDCVGSTCVQKADTCLIEGTCYDPGEILDDCYHCDPDQSQTVKSLLPGEPPIFGSDGVYIKTASDDVIISLQAIDPSGDGVQFTLVDPARSHLALHHDGTLRWRPQTAPEPVQFATVRITSTGCPRYRDVSIRLVTILCADICGFESCTPDPSSTPGRGDYVCSCDGQNVNRCEQTEQVCQNGGVCVPETCDYRCACAPDTTGTHCETRLSPVGTWSEWSEYTACTKPCDYGTQSRSRTCARTPCTGTDEQTTPCNSFNCQKIAQEADKGAVVAFTNADIQEISEKQDDIRHHTANALSAYCQSHPDRCCTSVLLRVSDDPDSTATVFLPMDVGVASGYPTRDDNSNILLKLIVEVDVSQLVPLCDTTEDAATSRRKRQVADIRAVSTDFLEEALEYTAGSYVQTLGGEFQFRVVSDADDRYLKSIVIPVAATCGVIGLILTILIIIVCLRKCQQSLETRRKEQEEAELEEKEFRRGRAMYPYDSFTNSSSSSDPGYDGRGRLPRRVNTRQYDRSGSRPARDPYWTLPWSYLTYRRY